MSSPTLSAKASHASRPTVEAEPSSLEKFAQDSLTSFIADLEAANRFKTYLLEIGVEVPSDVLEGLAKLTDEISSSDEPKEVKYFDEESGKVPPATFSSTGGGAGYGPGIFTSSNAPIGQVPAEDDSKKPR